MALVSTLKTDNKPDNHSPFFVATDETTGGFVMCKRPDRVQALVDSVAPGKQVHFVSDGEWSMHDIVIALLKKFRPAELFISTYAIRDFPIKQLILAQERGEVSGINLVIDSRAQIRSPEGYNLARMNVNRIAQIAIHAKVTVIKSPIGCVSISSSQNWTQNPKIEAGVITCSEEVAAFHIAWINKILADAQIFE